MPELHYIKLNDHQVAEEMAVFPGWCIENGQLTKTFEFGSYKDGVVFASAIGFVADKLDHHPDITITYRKVKIAVNTHSVDGISPYDFELARRIENL